MTTETTTTTDHDARDFDVTRHNGLITIRSAATGDHRTFRIHTVKEGDLSGKRIVGLLRGPQNDADESYLGFAFADEFGIKVWRRFRATDGTRTDWERFARILENLRGHVDAGRVTADAALRCRRCGRLLTDPDFVARGLGPTCAQNS